MRILIMMLQLISYLNYQGSKIILVNLSIIIISRKFNFIGPHPFQYFTNNRLKRNYEIKVLYRVRHNGLPRFRGELKKKKKKVNYMKKKIFINRKSTLKCFYFVIF
jgi:hypothetical protein